MMSKLDLKGIKSLPLKDAYDDKEAIEKRGSNYRECLNDRSFLPVSGEGLFYFSEHLI